MGQFQQGNTNLLGQSSGKGGSNPSTSGQAQMGQPNQSAQQQSIQNLPLAQPTPVPSSSPTTGGGKSTGAMSPSSQGGKTSMGLMGQPSSQNQMYSPDSQMNRSYQNNMEN